MSGVRPMSGIRPLTGSSRRTSILGLSGPGACLAPPACTELFECRAVGSLGGVAAGALQPLAQRSPSNELNETASFASSRPGTAGLRGSLLSPVVEQELLNTASMSQGWQPTVCTRPHPGVGGEGRPFSATPPRSAQSNQSGTVEYGANASRRDSFNSLENFHELAQSDSSQLPIGWGLIGNLQG